MLITMLSAALIAAQTAIAGLGVVPTAGQTAVVIKTEQAEPVAVRDFLLSDPARLVIDISGARHELERQQFTRIDRGGVSGLRVSQYTSDVVRVVIDLEQSVEYTVERSAGEVRVTFPNPGGAFEPWRVQNREPAAPAGASQRPERAPSAAPQPPPLPPITVAFRETPIKDVLATFAEFTGRSIVAGGGVSGTVSADIRNQPWDVALKAILRANGLTAQEMESGIIRVGALGTLRKREKQQPLVTRPFRIQYASAESLRPAIEGLLTERGSITVSPNTNTLIVTDGRSVVEDRIAPMIDKLDVRTPQVAIKAKLVFVNRTGMNALGVSYDLKDSRGNQINTLTGGFEDLDGDGEIDSGEATDQNVVSLGGNSIAALANAAVRVAQPQLQIVSSLVLGRHSLLTFVDALQSLNLTDIQAAPTVTVLDNRTARVQVGEETPIRVVDAGAAGSGPGAPQATVETQQTGVILEVTPHVTGNQVLLDLHAERSNVAAAPSDIGITFQTQETDTELLVNDGETVVIGGLTSVNMTESRSGIPILMDLPWIGGLFRTTQRREVKRDLLIMITPHIIRQGQ